MVGIVRRPHGLAGEVSVESATDFPERFVTGARVFWRRGGDVRSLTISEARPHGARWLFRFDEVEGLDSAAGLAGGDLCVPESEITPRPEEYYYGHDLEGWVCENSAGERLGTVERIDQSAGGGLLSVASADGRSVLVPFVRPIIVLVDSAARRVVIDPPEGLWDL